MLRLFISQHRPKRFSFLHEKAAHHAHSAHSHATHARDHAEHAGKAHAEEHGKKVMRPIPDAGLFPPLKKYLKDQ